MALVPLSGVVGRSGSRSRTALALFVVLALSGGALIFAAGEARAQQLQTPEAHASVTGSERAPESSRGLAESATGSLTADPPSQVDERTAGSSFGPEPGSVVSSGAPEVAPTQSEEFGPTFWASLLSEPVMPESFGTDAGWGPAYEPALPDPGPVQGLWYPAPFADPLPAPGPAGFGLALPYPGAPEPVWNLGTPEAYKPTPPRVGGSYPVLSPTGASPGVRPAPHGGNGVAKAVPVGPLPPVVDRKASPPASASQQPPAAPAAGPSREEAALLLSSLEAAASSAVETLNGAAADASGDPAPSGEAPPEPYSGGGEKEPSEDAPLPPSPAPLGGSYFSPSAGGQIGPGGVVPMLICVLAAGLILLRPAGRLSWAYSELPKPSPVLLGPLERPG